MSGPWEIEYRTGAKGPLGARPSLSLSACTRWLRVQDPSARTGCCIGVGQRVDTKAPEERQQKQYYAAVG